MGEIVIWGRISPHAVGVGHLFGLVGRLGDDCTWSASGNASADGSSQPPRVRRLAWSWPSRVAQHAEAEAEAESSTKDTLDGAFVSAHTSECACIGIRVGGTLQVPASPPARRQK